MPKQIASYHSNYVSNFLNRRRGTRLRTPHITSFAINKYGELKVLGIAIKLEFFMLDDIYMCSILNSHPRNNQNLMLTEFNGNIASLNKKGLESYGENIFLNSHALFNKIPSLIKYYYPKLTKYLNYRKISGRRRKTK